MAIKKNGVAVLDDTGVLVPGAVANVPAHIERVHFVAANCGNVLQVTRTRAGDEITFTLTLAAANCNCLCNC